MQVKFVKSLCLLAVCLLLQLVAGNAATVNPTQTQTDTRVSWIAQLLQLRQQLGDCYRSGSGLWACFRARSLQIFEDIMAADVIPLYEGVRLMAAPNATNGQPRAAADERKDLKHLTWFDQLAVRLAKGLTTHTLQINLAKLTERYLSNGRWLYHGQDIISLNIFGLNRLQMRRRAKRMRWAAPDYVGIVST